MTNYTKITNFAAKDTLTPGDANKKVKGTEIDNEFNAIVDAIDTKADSASPALTGTPTAPTAATGTDTTQVATTAFVQTELAATPRIVSYHHVPMPTNVTSTSTTEYDLGMSVTMTPASSTNKLLIFANAECYARGSGDDMGYEFKLFIDSSQVVEQANAFYSSNSSVTGAGLNSTMTIIYEHSPGSTAELTIDCKGNLVFGATEVAWYATSSSITVLEIEP